MTVKPYINETDNKKSQVARMFNNIAPKYDLLNHLLSMGIDKIWRKRAINLLKPLKNGKILDVATGTGDLAIAIQNATMSKVSGLDLSSEMLKVAEQKISKIKNNQIELIQGDSENLPFESNLYDAVTVAFGVRNFEDLIAGLKEMQRVLKPNGKMIILEFSKPSSFPMKQVYNFYFKTILPFWGGLISKDKAAYTYLPESVNKFPEGQAFKSILNEIGMKEISEYRQTFGIATIYYSEKSTQ